MEYILDNQFSWSNFLLLAAFLLGLYFALHLILELLGRGRLLGRWQTTFRNIVQTVLLIFEPLGVLLLLGAFIMINPVFHVILVGLILLVALPHLKNYITGRVLQFDENLRIGYRIETDETKGIVKSIDRLGIQLNTNKGVQFINYANLLKNGFVLLAGETVGGFYNMKITPDEPEEKKNYAHELKDFLAIAPYLNQQHFPKIQTSLDTPNQFNVRLMVHEENHLNDFISLMKERGYSCRISKK